MFKEFKEFAMKGNLVDLAVGFILGGAFSTIVKSLVNDIIMPPLGLVLGGVDFADLLYPLDGNTYESLEAANEAGAPVIAYGLFINNVISFLIMAFALFFVVKGINSMKRKQEEAPAEVPPPPRQEVLLEEIRNLLAKQQS
ncbi:MAG TPA: large conductance mechanosensitive channel protein MscL [Henriciella marina]|uniref:large conductance mechanosensitive channel protein MscL n=1 Tax=Henriciella sp. TaxID=1968823 RepID=UPI0017D67BDA|nr:large conductance mechanosensitive channel protein MscL [Henriciella sp.]QYJ02131.1 large conductance mechanosensitive channel protein MscL [Thalassovita mediterranea]HIG23978.1 large conductance mechanosensitive channel protein MscL [Henriciella sp.]HIK64283.1 large conductance mechanosensitive channel protein MscL [Henriciella marina]